MRLLRVTLLTTLGLCVAELAHTGPPDPVHSTLSGAFIDLAGTTPSGAPDVCGDTGCPDYNLTFRNFANIPIAGATIVIDFSGCPDIQLSSDQVGRYPTQTVVCPSQIQGTTDADGKFTFSIEGRALPNTTPGSYEVAGRFPCAQFYANGEPLSTGLFVSAYDVDGISTPGAAVNAADAAAVARAAADVLTGGPQYARMDFTHSGTLTAADAAREAQMAADRLVGTGSSNTGPFCP